MIDRDTANFKYFSDIYSDEPYKIDTLAVNAFSKDAYQQLKDAKIGDTFGPVPSSKGYELIHLINIISTNEKFVRASHILIPHQGEDEKNKLLADSIYTALKNGADFKEMAMKYSKDPGSAKNGGDLGWFGKGMMVKEFEDAVFNAKVGEVQKPISTTFGYHIILVTGETNKKYVVEQIINKVQESATTKDAVFNAAKDFAYLADKNGFENEAELGGYKIQQSTAFMKNTTTIPGIGPNKRMINFAFENDLNDVSDAIKEPNGFVVAKISEIIPEGIQKFEDVKPRVRELLIKEKQYEKGLQLATEVMKKAGNDLAKVPQIDPRLNVVNTGNFNTTSVVPNIGRDNAFIQRALLLKVGEVSEPFKSLRGYYVMKLTEKTPFDSTLFKAQSSTIRNSLIQEKKNASLNEWLTLIKDKADIVDDRYKFYSY
ncbi:MAG: peptidylprolyl isomerase [Ignavibacteriaceae bacterium]